MSEFEELALQCKSRMMTKKERWMLLARMAELNRSWSTPYPTSVQVAEYSALRDALDLDDERLENGGHV